jgi:TnpA family transposase
MFSRFIPCCVHEGIYIIDELIKNESDAQLDTIIRGDTQAQNGPAFGPAHLLGISLMPRIRHIKHLVLYKADKRRRYKHIESICRASIDRELIDADVLKTLFALSAGAYQSLWGLSVGFAEEGAATLYKHNFRL